jgi:methylenetetrahydrofolate--tRNA-(uracil-5-)-methyltransferase
LLNLDLSFRSAPQIFVAGQLSGVEGYVECISTGLLAGLALAARAVVEDAGQEPGGAPHYTPPPRTTALGSLVHYITHASTTNYQPANISFDLLAPIEGLPKAIARDKRARREKQCERALVDFGSWMEAMVRPLSVVSGPLPVATEQPTIIEG